MMSNATANHQSKHDSLDSVEVHVEEFIPYACHFNPHTILTKNGELMQVIKITGFNFETVENAEHEVISLRRTIRQAVKESIKTDNFSLWIHTLRRKKDLSFNGAHDGFAGELHQQWTNRHGWDEQYVNEVYISVLIEGQSLSLKDIKALARHLFFPLEFKYRRQFLENAADELHHVVDDLLTRLESYGAQRLGIFQEDGIYRSQLTSFIGKLVNLKEVPLPLALVDLSELLPSHKIAFGFNRIEVAGDTGRHFGCMLTVKEYHEVSTQHIDRFLQLPHQFTVTETFDFVSSKMVNNHFDLQKRIVNASNDDQFIEMSGIRKATEGDEDSPTDFGEHQLSIMLYEDSPAALNAAIIDMIAQLNELGIVAIREDVFLEDSYWAQLPGNFDFIKRMTPIASSMIAGYASLYNFPAGQLSGNRWGDAVTIFHTDANTPYFFNFHYGDCGHSCIIGPYGQGKTVLLNFLLSETQKYQPNIFFFDHNRGSEVFLRAIGGDYHRILDEQTNQLQFTFNPFLYEDSPDHRSFLVEWLGYLTGQSVTESEKSELREFVQSAYSLPQSQRILSELVAHTMTLSPELKQKLDPWCTHSEHANPHAGIFDSNSDGLSHLDSAIVGFDMQPVEHQPQLLLPVVAYMLHHVTMRLDGTPTIIVLDEAWQLIDHPGFADHLTEWLDILRAKNAIAIFATEAIDKAANSSVTRRLMEQFTTRIFLPNPGLTPEHQRIFDLSTKEMHLIKNLDGNRREFLLKHHIDSIVAHLNLENLPFILSVLSASENTLKLFDRLGQQVGSDHSQWLPALQRNIEEA